MPLLATMRSAGGQHRRNSRLNLEPSADVVSVGILGCPDRVHLNWTLRSDSFCVQIGSVFGLFDTSPTDSRP